ncbi:MAG: hypothetical protein AAF206_16730 [Bacteroidota bacterium]
MISPAEERLSLLSSERKLLLFMLQQLHEQASLSPAKLLPYVNGDPNRLDRLVQHQLLIRFDGNYVLPVDVRRMLRPEQQDTWTDAACHLADLIGQFENRLSLVDPSIIGLQDNLLLVRNALQQDLESRYLDWHHICIFSHDADSRSAGRDILAARLKQDHANLDKLQSLLSVHPWVRKLVHAELISLVLSIREQIPVARKRLDRLEDLMQTGNQTSPHQVHLIKALRDRQQLDQRSDLSFLLEGIFPDGPLSIQARPPVRSLRILQPPPTDGAETNEAFLPLSPVQTPSEKIILTPDWEKLWNEFSGSGQDLFSFVMKLHWQRSLGPEIRLQWFLRMHQLYAEQLVVGEKWVELYGHKAREIRLISDFHTDLPAKAPASQKKNNKSRQS